MSQLNQDLQAAVEVMNRSVPRDALEAWTLVLNQLMHYHPAFNFAANRHVPIEALEKLFFCRRCGEPLRLRDDHIWWSLRSGPDCPEGG